MLLASFALLAACDGAAADEAGMEGERAIELQAGAATSFDLHVDSPAQFTLISDTGMKARIEASSGDQKVASEWSSTPFVNVFRSE